MSRTRTPVVAGWFTATDRPEDFRLLGTRCTGCGSVFFPREDSFCRNPACTGTDLIEVPLSRRGRVWSFTDGRYRPPAPYASDPGRPWEPYTLVAVELAAERMVVLGQAAPGVRPSDLAVGMEVEVVPGVLNEDEEHIWTTWHWRPVEESEPHRAPGERAEGRAGAEREWGHLPAVAGGARRARGTRARARSTVGTGSGGTPPATAGGTPTQAKLWGSPETSRATKGGPRP